MPQALRATTKWKNFNFPVSYNVNVKGKMRDARNVYSKEDMLKTRPGIKRYNSTVIGSGTDKVLSVSYYEKPDGTKYTLAKVGDSLYSVSETGAHTVIKSGLDVDGKHRSITYGDGRAIITVENEPLMYAWDGTIFSQLGQDPPQAPTVAKTNTGATLPAADYQVAITFVIESLGFETNIGTSSTNVTIALGEQIDVSVIPDTADNAFVDKKRVYVRDATNAGEWFFWEEIDLAVTTSTVDEEVISTITPPEKNAAPVDGGGKYLTLFGSKLAYAGSDDFQQEIFFSENNLADAFDSTSTRLVIKGSGQGPITGIASGTYNQDNLAPYVCIFKRSSIQVFSDFQGPSLTVVSSKVGCVAHDTIQEIEGDVYFMSSEGWYKIENGKIQRAPLIENGQPTAMTGEPRKLGDMDLDPIFTQKGYVYEINQQDSGNFFSVFYNNLRHHMTFISEGSNVSKNKCYNYELDLKGFRPLEFKIAFNDGAVIKDDNSNEVCLLAGPDGRLYKYSIQNDLSDVDTDGVDQIIDAFAQLYWMDHADLDSTSNYGTMIYTALSNTNPLEVRTFFNYELDMPVSTDYNFSKDETGFILDVSLLDVGILGDGRTIVRGTGGVYRTARSMLVGFYKSVLNESMDLINGQVDASKNGNPAL